jgi:hypothetical protein
MSKTHTLSNRLRLAAEGLQDRPLTAALLREAALSIEENTFLTDSLVNPAAKARADELARALWDTPDES